MMATMTALVPHWYTAGMTLGAAILVVAHSLWARKTKPKDVPQGSDQPPLEAEVVESA